MAERINVRDTEIKRLQMTSVQSNAGARSTLDTRQAHETIQTQIKKIEALSAQHSQLLDDVSEVRELLGASDMGHLKKVVKSLKQRNETLFDENR
jgi:uncharacterized protein (UPF0335 family)